ncbi:MAG: Ig domain-containing protein [archaeon]
MKTKILLLPLFFLLAVNFVFAAVEVEYIYTDYETGNHLEDVDYIVYTCENSDCSDVRMIGLPNPNFPWNSNEVPPNWNLIVQYPTQLETQYGYAVYFFKDEYAPIEGFADWSGNGELDWDVEFQQGEDCQALIQNFDVTNEVYPNMPLMINVNAIIDWDTYSPFEPNGETPEFIPVVYDPSNPDVQIFPEFYNLYAGETEITLKIYDESNNVVFEQTNTENIFMGESVQTTYVWVPTQLGQYTARVEADVVDNQCASSIMSYAEDEFSVIEQNPDEMCYTLIHDFEISEIYPQVGDDIVLSAKKISNHLNNETGVLTPVETDVELTIYKKLSNNNYEEIFNELQHLPENPNPNVEVPFEFDWTAQEEGIYSFELYGIANDPLCEGIENLGETKTIGDTVIGEIENNEPTIEIVAPIENQIIDDTYTIVWYANDSDQASSTLDIKIEYKEYNSNNWIILEDEINNNDGMFYWNTETVDDGHYTIKITVTDDESASAYDQVSIYVNNEIIINEPPAVDITSPINFEIISGLYNIEWEASDLEQPSDTLDVKVEYKEDNWMAFMYPWITIFESPNNPGNHLWNTLPIEDGNYKLRVTVTDNEGEEDEDEIMFTINNEIALNHNPEIISSPVTIAYVNQLYNYDVNAIDIDGDSLIYMFDSSIPQGMTIDYLTGLITWTPTEEGSHVIVAKVSDEHGAYDTQQYVLNVYTQQEPEPQPEIQEREKHKFLISNVIAKKRGNFLDVYVDIDNKGNKKENVNLKATIMETGDTVYDTFNLYVYDGYWRQLRFNKPSKGTYVIRVEAQSSDYDEIKYIYVRV